jgi:hypothetical protein
MSTCCDHRHRGQWLVYPLPRTGFPQREQVKSSLRRVNEGGWVITCQHSTRNSRQPGGIR